MTHLKALNIASYIILILAFITMVYVGCLLWWPVKAYESNSVITDKLQYYQGDELVFTDDRCKYLGVPVDVNITLTDGILYQYATRYRNSPVGCSKVISEPLTIPSYAIPGKYHVEIILTFHINSIRRESFTIKTNEFEVLPLEEEL